MHRMFLSFLQHPDEIIALFKFKLGGCEAIMPKCNMDKMTARKRKSYEFLKSTSRSFASVIQALEDDIRHAVCIFYLALRALDTVEDDMTLSTEVKIPMLRDFHKYLYDTEWKFMMSQEKDKQVLEEFSVISGEFLTLKSTYQNVIADIVKRMGQGMIKYLDKSPDTMDDWDTYCHYVAGLVGVGLTDLFIASGKESRLRSPKCLVDSNGGVMITGDPSANSMGLFLQKTNIIRDFLEDTLEGRDFWPREAWAKYSPSLLKLSYPENRVNAIRCLNELITDALRHIPDCIDFLSKIQDPSIFNFCAIPQVMAIATLERCYNNPNVITGVVKIRKGEAVKLMMSATSMTSVKSIFHDYTSRIKARIPAADPFAEKTSIFTQDTSKLCSTSLKPKQTFLPVYVSFGLLTSAIVYQYWTSISRIISPL